MKIKEVVLEIKARQIITSRGLPTIEVELITTKGIFLGSCPSGASTGTNEACVILDKDVLFEGKGVVNLIKKGKEELFPKLKELEIEITDQKAIDEFLCKCDGTKNKSNFGANLLLPLSLVFCRAGAAFSDLPLFRYISKLSNQNIKVPIPHFNVINGGVHAGSGLKFQEIMIVFTYSDFTKNYEQATLFYKALKKTIEKKYGIISTGVGDEGGFAPPLNTLTEALDLIMETYEQGFSNMKIAIDAAASEFHESGFYDIGPYKLTGEDLVDYYVEIINKYPLIYSLEDPFEEFDYTNWYLLNSKIGSKIQIIGDDLTVTNPEYINLAIQKDLCNGLLVKLNQIGTVSEAIGACLLARSSNFKLMVSHRSGETSDSFIADFSVGIGAECIKSGAPCRGERVEKYNQILRITEGL